MHKLTLVAVLFVAVVAIIQGANADSEHTQDEGVVSLNGTQEGVPEEVPGGPHVRLSCYRRCLRECRGKKNRGCKGNKCICVN